MHRPAFVGFFKTGIAKVDLELELQIPLGCFQPNRSDRCRKGLKQSPQQLPIEDRRGHFRFAKA
jgi:hypothetical protein